MNFEMKTNREKASGPVLPSSRPIWSPQSHPGGGKEKNYEECKITWALGIREMWGRLYKFRAGWTRGKDDSNDKGRIDLSPIETWPVTATNNPDLYQLPTAIVMQRNKQSPNLRHRSSKARIFSQVYGPGWISADLVAVSVVSCWVQWGMADLIHSPVWQLAGY